MSMSLLELVEAAGFNPRNPDDAIRLTAILNDDDIERIRDINDNVVDLDYNLQQAEALTGELDDISDDDERAVILEDINRYNELAKEHQAVLKELLHED